LDNSVLFGDEAFVAKTLRYEKTQKVSKTPSSSISNDLNAPKAQRCAL